MWRTLDDARHVRLVEGYFGEAGFADVELLDRSPRRMFSDPLYAIVGRKPGA